MSFYIEREQENEYGHSTRTFSERSGGYRKDLLFLVIPLCLLLLHALLSNHPFKSGCRLHVHSRVSEG